MELDTTILDDYFADLSNFKNEYGEVDIEKIFTIEERMRTISSPDQRRKMLSKRGFPFQIDMHYDLDMHCDSIYSNSFEADFMKSFKDIWTVWYCLNIDTYILAFKNEEDFMKTRMSI